MLSAEPEEGYVFDGWFVADNEVSDEDEYSFIIESDMVIEARFSQAGNNTPWAGQWDFSWDNYADPDSHGSGTMNLTQTEDIVEGTYQYTWSLGGEYYGEVEGNVVGDTVSLDFTETDGSWEGWGTIELEISGDYDSFEGTWENNIGETGGWYGSRS